MTPIDLMAQFLATATNPIVLLAAVLFVVVTHRPWRVRAGTMAVGAGFGLLEGIDHGLEPTALAPVGASILAGLFVAEAVLHLLVPLAAMGLGMIGAVLGWFRKER